MATSNSIWVRCGVVNDEVVKANPSELRSSVEDVVAELCGKSEKHPSVPTSDVASFLPADICVLNENINDDAGVTKANRSGSSYRTCGESSSASGEYTAVCALRTCIGGTIVVGVLSRLSSHKLSHYES